VKYGGNWFVKQLYSYSLFEHRNLLIMETNVQQMPFNEPALNAIENSKAKFKVKFCVLSEVITSSSSEKHVFTYQNMRFYSQ
jgi:hypothetical protein